MHMIANDLLIADNEHVKAWRNHFHDVIGHQGQSMVRSAFLPGITQIYME